MSVKLNTRLRVMLIGFPLIWQLVRVFPQSFIFEKLFIKMTQILPDLVHL